VLKPRRQSYPRVNCLVADCRRGTTRCPPNADGGVPEIICGKHWRMVPKAWRQTMTMLRRRYTSAERKGDEAGMRRAARIWWQSWGRIVALFNDPESVMNGELPAALSEGLRREGLL